MYILIKTPSATWELDHLDFPVMPYVGQDIEIVDAAGDLEVVKVKSVTIQTATDEREKGKLIMDGLVVKAE